MNESSQIGSCSRCGVALAPGALKGLCPRCLMELNLVAPTEIPGEVGPHGTRVTKPLPTPEEVAKHFPQLEILECLGRGGMGVVYKARQPKLNRVVALKILAPEKEQDPKFAERFAREAQALARLNHPNIVTVYDFGEADGLYYLLMEFADGVSLRHLLHGGKVEPEEALAIVPKICEALQYAHDEGVVHRDIKPENILLDKKGRVKIADFGIAKIMGGDGRAGSPMPAEITEAEGGAQGTARPSAGFTEGQVLGTPNYMAPEQVEHPQKVDHRADIYSLGVVFYEMLTGELPLGKFQPPSKKVQVDVRLDEVVLHTLEKEPELRYQKASQVKTAVETIAHTPPHPPPAAQPTRRGAAWKVAVAAMLVLIVAFGVFLWTRSHSARSGGLGHSWPTEAAVDLGGGVKMEFVLIRSGSFRMGSDLGDEGPVRGVAIMEPFYLGKYEVTQEQWESVMGTNPSQFKGPKLPVDNVSADDAQDFLGRVREKTGRAFALPTEEQWEYACRAGSTTSYSFGDSPARLGDYAWFVENSDDITHPVGAKKPNRWGLYDMHGNVWERCTDGNDFHVMRGGAYSLGPKALRASNRAADGRGYSRVGLRCVLADRSGFAGQTKTAVQLKTPAQELAKDDGVSAGQSSEGGSGHAVRFEAPGQDCYLTAVRIFGSRYGHAQTPWEDASVWLCDTSFKKIAEFTAPYSYFVRGDPRWVTIPVRPTKVPPEFIICVGFDPTYSKGVYVHYDSGGSGSSFLGLPGGRVRPFGKGDWLIRAVVREENTPAARGNSGLGKVATGVAGTPNPPLLVSGRSVAGMPKPPVVVSGRKRETSPGPAEAPAIREDIDKDIPLAEGLRRANEQFPDPQPLTEEEVIAAVRTIKLKHPDIPDAFYQAYQRVATERVLPKGMYFSHIPGWVTDHGTFEVDWKDLTLITLPVGSKGPCFNYRIRARFISSEPRQSVSSRNR